MGRFWRRLSMMLRRRRLDRELNEEIQFHLEMQAAEGGRAAEFGNVTLVREAAQASWGWPALDDFLRELRYALRGLSRMPVATGVAVASLGVGIGVVAAIFSIADAVFFRPLQVPEADELVSLYQRRADRSGGFSSFAYPQYEHLRDHNRSFQSLAAFSRIPVNVQTGDSSERWITELVSNNYFDVLRLTPVLGRPFLPDDGNVVILGQRLWRTRFGSDPNVIGRTVVLNRQPFTVAGVLPASFQSVVLDWGEAPDLWVPMTAHAVFRDLPVTEPGSHWMLVTGRLKPGVSVEQAQSDAEALSGAFYGMHPFPGMKFQTVVFPTQKARFWPAYRSSVASYVVLLTVVGALTFFMACFNVANLLLVRAEKRKRELGIQIAIGAGPLRLARAMLWEAVLLAMGGAIAGFALASFAPSVFDAFHNPFGIPLALDLSLNLRVVAMVTVLAATATILVGVSPARLAWRIDVTSLIKNDSGAAQSRGYRVADLLVVAQVAICLIALTGAGVFVRTLERAQASDPMFRASDALLVDVDLLSAGYEEQRGQPFLRELLTRVRQIPGVNAAGYVKTVPLGGFRGARDIRLNGVAANVQVNTVSAGYFGAAGIPLLRGRDLRDGDTSSVVINQQMAERFWPGSDPIGRVIEVPRGDLRFTVAGVVRDGRMRNFREPEVVACVYLPLEADFQRMITLYVRTAGPPVAAVARVRGTMRELNRDVPFQSATLEAHLNTALARERMAAAMLSGVAAFTTLLVAIGLYGLISVVVSQRSREIGIRMALGARRERVVAGVMKRFAWLLGAGVAIGVVASAGLARFVESWVFGVQPMDPVTLSAACLVLAGVAAVAATVPVMRAALTDPLRVLRHD